MPQRPLIYNRCKPQVTSKYGLTLKTESQRLKANTNLTIKAVNCSPPVATCLYLHFSLYYCYPLINPGVTGLSAFNLLTNQHINLPTFSFLCSSFLISHFLHSNSTFNIRYSIFIIKKGTLKRAPVVPTSTPPASDVRITGRRGVYNSLQVTGYLILYSRPAIAGYNFKAFASGVQRYASGIQHPAFHVQLFAWPVLLPANLTGNNAAGCSISLSFIPADEDCTLPGVVSFLFSWLLR